MCYGNFRNPNCTAPGLSRNNNSNGNNNNDNNDDNDNNNESNIVNTTIENNDDDNNSSNNDSNNGNNDSNNDNNNRNNGTRRQQRRRRGPHFLTVKKKNSNHNKKSNNTNEDINNSENTNGRSDNRESEFLAKERSADKEHNILETEENLNKWVVLDSATVSSVACNPKYVKGIRSTDEKEELYSNGGSISVNETAEFLGIGRLPYSSKAKTNLLGMFAMIKLGFRIYMDSNIDNKIYVEKDNKVRVFIPVGMRNLEQRVMDRGTSVL